MAKPQQAALRADLDGPLTALLELLRDSASYGTARDRALEIAARYTVPEGESLDCRRFLLSPSWKATWETAGYVTCGMFFSEGRDDESEALFAVFTELARYVLDAKTEHRRQEYRKQFQAALQDYLELRGAPLPSAPCARCGQFLTLYDLRNGHGECHDCRSPKGKIADLDIAIRASGDTYQRIPEIKLRPIRHLLRQRFGPNLSFEELWERCTDWLHAEGVDPNDYLTWPLERLAEWLRDGMGTSASSNEKEEQTPALSERKYLILQTLLEFGATSAIARRTTAEVAEKAEGKSADPVQFKRAIVELRNAGYLNTKGGRGGGCWLTTTGNSLAARLA